MSDTHEANVVRVGPITPHPNADKLELTMVGGFQVVLGKDQFKEGDLAVYIQPDSVVPQTEPFKFIWEKYAFEQMPQADLDAGLTGKVIPMPIVPERRRRITVKRLRKEYSEGLLMPVAAFPMLMEWVEQYDAMNTATRFQVPSVTEGTDVAAALGITHYVPEEDPESTKADTAAKPKRKYPRTLRGWFYWTLRRLGLRNAGGRSYAQEIGYDFPIYDVNALKNATRNRFADCGDEGQCGEMVTMTEKIHGSNARFVFVADGTKPNPLNPAGKFYLGSHEQWKLDGPHVWGNACRQFPQIEEWCTQHPGLVLYGEVGPTQKGFRYGCENGETFFFAFDVFNPETGEWFWPGNLGFPLTAPILYSGPYSAAKVKELVDGPSVVPGAKNIREGIVISSKERRLKLKVVSNAYYEGSSK